MADPIAAGIIVMWSGYAENVPEGWFICDGQNGTPDLRNRFIVGAGDKYTHGEMGGEDSITLNLNQVPPHSHGVTDPGHSHSLSHFRDSSTDEDDCSLKVYARDNNDTKSTSTGYTGISIKNAVGGVPHENRPPYFALCFLMRK